MLLFEGPVDIGNNGNPMGLVQRKLGERVKGPDIFDFHIEQFNSVREIVAVRKDVDNPSADRKLSGFEHKILPGESKVQQEFNHVFHAQLFAGRNIEPVGLQNFRGKDLFKKGFRVRDDDLSRSFGLAEYIDQFGAHLHIRRIDFLVEAWPFKGIWKEVDRLFLKKPLQIVLEVRSGIFIFFHNKKEPGMLEIGARNGKCFEGANHSAKVDFGGGRLGKRG